MQQVSGASFRAGILQGSPQHRTEDPVPGACVVPMGSLQAMLTAPPAAAMCFSDAAAAADDPSHSAVCRICLAADDTEDLIQPCSCAGTMQHVHASCLAAWVKERGSLVCELCLHQYGPPHAQLLQPLAAAALEQKGLQPEAATLEVHGRASTGLDPRMYVGDRICLTLALALIIFLVTVAVVAVAKFRGFAVPERVNTNSTCAAAGAAAPCL